MRTHIWAVLTIFVVSFASGCGRKDSGLDEATSAFKQRYPGYVVRSAKAVKRDERVSEVALEFDAPDNAKNRGRADLILHRDKEGSWTVVEEKIKMWTR